MSEEIEILSSVVSDQIAAGEVIERPASIVKELVENSLDAGASQIDVLVTAGGRDEIVVRDDGSGMGQADAQRACLRHATSKLRAIEELAGIASFGFRGEALASISAVSETTIVTRPKAADEGVQVRVVHGEVAEVLPAGVPRGTSITIKDLFASVPARRKFLRTPQTELAHISDWLQRAALAHPEVAFSLTHGAREVFRHPAVRSPDERLRQVQGPTRSGEMVPCQGDVGGVRVRGWISRAGTSYAQSRAIVTYVGGRVVRDKILTRAILDGYRALMPRGRYPAVVLFLEVPAGMVDVNVHPTKVEVRFADGDAVYSAVLGAIRRALEEGVQAPAGPPGSGSGDHVRDRVSEALTRYGASTPRPETRTYGIRDTGRATGKPKASAGRLQQAISYAEPAAGAASTTRPLFGDLRVVGQALRGYIVCEGADGLVLVDQHAAHERVLFERLRAQAPDTLPSQQLLVPAVVAMDGPEIAALAANSTELSQAGFEIESFGEGRVVLRAVPAALDVSTDMECLFADLAQDLGEIRSRGSEERVHAARDLLLARVACHSAVRVGDPLVFEEMQRLVADLDTIPFAATCPHGRPLMAELSRREIERRVRRA